MRLNNLQTNKENINSSNEIDKERIPEHVAIIMDGNGRWAMKKGLPRSYGPVSYTHLTLPTKRIV